MLTATPRWVGAFCALKRDLHYAGYVLWRGCLPETALANSEPLVAGIHALGYPGGHGVFYLVPGADGGSHPGQRPVNWAMYLPVAENTLAAFKTDRCGRRHKGSLPPGAMSPAPETALKRDASAQLPDFYAGIVGASLATFVYAIYACEVPAYRRERLCLAGDAGAVARPHSGAGALQGMSDAVSLADAIAAARRRDTRFKPGRVE